LAKACALLGTLSICSCSLLLDWNGYTGGSGTTQIDAAGSDATTADGMDEPPMDVSVAPMMDVQDARGVEDVLDATGDVADAREAGPAGMGPDASPPTCSSKVCGGCCIPSMGYCAGGLSAQTCGVGGERCQDCESMGLACVNGVCASPPEDAGAVAPCAVLACANLHRCIPAWQMACCRQDNSCGCQITIPPTDMCL
jgi:hypothetical protein